jgi:hypothetical protein
VTAEERRRPAASVTYDLSAYTVLPGLVDAHDHLAWHFNAAGKLHTASDGETPAQGALAMAANAWATLRAGITTAQSPGSPEDADLRAAIAQGLPGRASSRRWSRSTRRPAAPTSCARRSASASRRGATSSSSSRPRASATAARAP